MATYQVFIEGQTFPVPPEIGAEDANVKRALSAIYPGIDNAGITRTEKDGVVTITVIKKAGSKGADPLAHLADCAGGKNPAVALYEQLQAAGPVESLQPADLLALEARVQAALNEGEHQADRVKSAAGRLRAAAAQSAPAVVLGF